MEAQVALTAGFGVLHFALDDCQFIIGVHNYFLSKAAFSAHHKCKDQLVICCYYYYIIIIINMKLDRPYKPAVKCYYNQSKK